jgi:hypothetical protein
MRELTKDEINELDSVWQLIKSGKAPGQEAKGRAIVLWNKIAGTKFSQTSSCHGCLGKVFYGLEGLHKEYYK